MDIYLNTNGQQEGPYTLDQINHFLSERTLKTIDYAWYEGMSDWIFVKDLPGIILPTIAPAVLPSRFAPKSVISEKKNLVVFLLCFFFGYMGVHRFYVGKIGTGLIQFFTFGGFGIWWFIDLVIVLCGGFTDKEGKEIKNWS